MKKTIVILTLVFGTLPCANAADPKPVYKWMAANEYYMIMPTAQTLNISGGGSESVKPWGFGFRAVGNNETITKTGGLQFQSIKVDSLSTGRNTFYLWELLLGMEYMAPKVQGKPLRFTHHIVLSIIAWAVFGTLLVGRWRFGWRGRTAVRLTLAGFVLLVLGYFGTKFVLEVLLGRTS